MRRVLTLTATLLGLASPSWALSTSVHIATQPVRMESEVNVGASTTSKAILIAGYNDNGTTAVPSVSGYYNYKNMHVVNAPREAYDTYEGRIFSNLYEASVSGTNEVDFMLVVNLSTNTKRLVLHKIIFNVGDNSAVGTLRAYINPVVTSSGTTLSIYSRNLMGIPPVSQMQSYSMPTISSRGAKVAVFSSGQGQTMIDPIDSTFILGSGYTALFTVQNTLTNKPTALSGVWSEE